MVAAAAVVPDVDTLAELVQEYSAVLSSQVELYARVETCEAATQRHCYHAAPHRPADQFGRLMRRYERHSAGTPG